MGNETLNNTKIENTDSPCKQTAEDNQATKTAQQILEKHKDAFQKCQGSDKDVGIRVQPYCCI